MTPLVISLVLIQVPDRFVEAFGPPITLGLVPDAATVATRAVPVMLGMVESKYCSSADSPTPTSSKMSFVVVPLTFGYGIGTRAFCWASDPAAAVVVRVASPYDVDRKSTWHFQLFACAYVLAAVIAFTMAALSSEAQNTAALVTELVAFALRTTVVELVKLRIVV